LLLLLKVQTFPERTRFAKGKALEINMLTETEKDPVCRAIDDLRFDIGNFARVHRWQKKNDDGLIGEFLHLDDKVATRCNDYYVSLTEIFYDRVEGKNPQAKTHLESFKACIDADTAKLRGKSIKGLFFLASQRRISQDVNKFEVFSDRADRIIAMIDKRPSA
jgi:hypothetical protein